MARSGRFAGKRKAAGGVRGRGKGVGRKRKRGFADASDDETARDGAVARSSRKASGKGKRSREDEVDERLNSVARSVGITPRPLRPARPGFGALLKTFGIAEEGPLSSDDGSGEGIDDEADATDCKRLADGANAQSGMAPQGGDEEEEEGDECEVAAKEEEDDTSDDGVVASGPGCATAEGNGPDLYPRFWDDPPNDTLGWRPSEQVIVGTSAAAPAAAGSQRFDLPGLSRCEARRRDVTDLRCSLRSSADAVGAWKRCRLAPGLKTSFDEILRREGLEVGPKEGAMFAFLHSYVDVAFPEHTHLNGRVVRAMYMLHVADHVLKASAEVLKNTASGSKAKRLGADAGMDCCDKGFTRARVLVLCPFRSTCFELVNMLLALCPSRKEVANRSRFDQEFGPEDEDDEVENGKSPDWNYLFSGNNDDSFRLGIAMARKQVRLYAPFSRSDILICSPLGLRKITGAEGDRKREYDFLSSIELCVVDRADALRMQNWEHVVEILQVVNRRPQGLDGVDISRLRPAFADGRARAFRQTCVTSAGQDLDSETVFRIGCTASNGGIGTAATSALARKFGLGASGTSKKRRIWKAAEEDDEGDEDVAPPSKLVGPSELKEMYSLRGFVRLVNAPEGGPLQRATALGISRQFFLHAPCESLHSQGERLLEAFDRRYWKPLGNSLERLLIVAPNYFGFLRLRQFLRDAGASFCSVFEYSEMKALSRARVRFCHGERRVLLVTERFLWYRRYKLKGADYVLFCGPPETPQIYEDVLANTRTPSQCNSMCLFTKFDGLALERLAGHGRTRKMLASEHGKVFVFT